MAAGWERPPAAAALTLLLSLGVSAPGLLRGAPAARSAASLRPAALRAGEGVSADLHRAAGHPSRPLYIKLIPLQPLPDKGEI